MTLSRVLTFALSQVWALDGAFHSRMTQVLLRHAEGGGDADSVIAAATRAAASVGALPRRANEMSIHKGVATIPIVGVIAQRASAVSDVCSNTGTSVEHIRGDLRAALESPDVQAIVLQVDSPGGSVAGLDGLAAEIRAAREVKPIVAHTDSTMASAAYWLASQASRVYATSDAAVGSVGVIASFVDNHRALADRGLDPVVVKSTPGKGSVQSNGSFGDASRATLQAEVDQFHRMFVDAVAAGRSVPADRADAMGNGLVYIGQQAEAAGYVDGIRSFDASVRMARSFGRTSATAGHVTLVVDESETNQPTPTAGDVAKVTTNEGKMQTNETKPGATPVAEVTAQAITVATPEAIAAEAVAAERARVAAINTNAATVQSALAAKLIADGTPTGEALAAIVLDMRERLNATALAATADVKPLAAGNSSTVVTEAVQPQAKGVEGWRAEFAASQNLQAEFGSEAVYLGWRRNEANRQRNGAQ